MKSYLLMMLVIVSLLSLIGCRDRSCGWQRLGHAVSDGGNGLQVTEYRFEILIRHVLVHGDRHRRQDESAAAEMATAADGVLEVAQRPSSKTGLRIRRQIGSEAYAPRSGPCSERFRGSDLPGALV